MSQLTELTDPTGNTPQETLNKNNISNLIQELNNVQASTGNIIQQPTYIEINDGTTNRVLLGFNNTTQTWGIFAVPPGTDLGSVTDPRQFSFTSDIQYLFAPKSGVITIPGGTSSAPGNASFAATPIPHGLNYIPSVIGFAKGNVITNYPNVTSLNTILPNTFYDDSLNIHSTLTIASDATNIYAYNSVQFFTVSPTIPSFAVTYYVLNVSA